jgi:putative oxidoreductase
MNTGTALPHDRWAGDVLGSIADGFRLAERSLGPPLDLAIRLWLAQSFLVSGILKVSDWENALMLARDEYPVAWMDPVTAAYLGAGIELVCPVLLALGLATRMAALPMLVLSLVVQLNYVVLDVNLFWAVLLAWYVVMGPGRLSLDRGLARGLADSALPGAAAGMRLFHWVTRKLGPSFKLALRLWIAVALLAGSAWEAAASLGKLALPLQTAAHFPQAVAFICAALLALGLGTRFAALLLMAATVGGPMMGTWQSLYLYWVALAALVVLHGPGALSLDTLIERWLRSRYPQLEGKPAFSGEGLPRVVIVGAGFGGLACAAALRRTPAQVVLIDRHNYHLFQPLLYQVATTALSPNDVAVPVRSLFREQAHIRVLLGTVTGVDTKAREVGVGDQRLPYDYLVLATGAAHSYFGRDDWEPYAPGLKRIEDATEVRRRLLLAFERAEATDDPQERERLLTFIVVGGGPTGVELAGAIAELAHFGMEKEFRGFDPAAARVVLVQAGPRLLPTFPETLSEKARIALERLGVEVRTNSRVNGIDAAGVVVSGSLIPSGTVLWAAGVVASPAARWLGAAADNAGRIKVGPDLSVPGLPDVFAVGDTALCEAWDGRPVPGLAPAAKQEGAYVAEVIRARLAGRAPPRPFAYHHLGSLATIGRKAAVAEFGRLRVSGTPAWWLWGLVHIGFLVGLRNRVSVMWDWFWAYLTYRSASRLIEGQYAVDR